MAGIVARVDSFQRRHPVAGFPIAVLYKFFDDQGPYLAAILTYYGFLAIFPLLLIASSILGFLLQGNPDLQESVLDSALATFPIVGTQLGRPEGMTGSTSGVVVGLLAALYGVTGVGQAAQNALNVVWAVPRNSRLNAVLSRLRSLVLLALGGAALLMVTAVVGLANNLDALGIDVGSFAVVGPVLSVTITAVVLALMMRLTTTRRPSFRMSLPGAFVIAVLWHVLQDVGNIYVRGVLAQVSDVNAVFALVLGLIGLLFIAGVMAVLGLEVNVVLRRRLYPRALLTPFTDSVDLTDADRRAYASYAKAQRHKGFQHVTVEYDDEYDDEVT